MIIEYNVNCFDRCLVIKCDDRYAEHEREIKRILNKAYCDWHIPEDIEDLEERDWVENDACCEEYMMSKVQEIYPGLNEGSWDTFYYGNDEDEIIDDVKRHQNYRKYNIEYLDETIDNLENANYEFEPFEKFGNEAYWIVKDCIEKLKELKVKFVEESPFTVYKCRHCNFSCWDVDNDVEEELWGHIQMHHKDKFAEVQNWETPDMIEECYEEEV